MKYLTIIFILLILSGACRSPQVITDTVTRDSTIIREVPRIIEVPGQTATSPSINLDSLVTLIQSGVKTEVINRTLIRTDPETNMRVGLLLDELGNLSALCESQERTISIMEKEIERFYSEVSKTTVTKQPSFWQKLRSNLTWIFVGFAIAVAFSLLIKK